MSAYFDNLSGKKISAMPKRNRVVLKFECWQLSRKGEGFFREKDVNDKGGVTEKNHQL